MTKFILSLLFTFTSLSWAGAGGISGGHILFESVSTYVEPMNRTLCHNEVEFKATVTSCKPDLKDSCSETERVEISQPILSTKNVCVRYSGGQCAKWKTRNFYQSPERNVDIVDSHDHIRGETVIVIPPCIP